MRAFATTAATALIFLAGSTDAAFWSDFSHGVNVIPSLDEMRFRTWIMQHKKMYSTKEEYRFRYTEFSKTAKYIEEHNKYNPSFELTLNEYSDITDEEWDKMLPQLPAKNKNEFPMRSFPNCTSDNTNALCDLPTSKNWKDLGYVTDVKQTPNNCPGASYAFASADAVEATYKNGSNPLTSMSPKQMMDCGVFATPKQDFTQCFGDTQDAFQYIQNGYKLMTLKDYPVGSINDKSCKYDASKGLGGLSKIFAIPVDPNGVKQALQFGPVAAVVNSKAQAFNGYKSGIITDPDGTKCDNRSPNLYVLIVGYGVDNGQGFFLIKNNWGSNWGDNGYVKISDSPKNVCGIMTPQYMFQITNEQ